MTMKQVVRFIVDNSDEELLGLRLEMFVSTLIKAVVAVYVVGQIAQEKVSAVYAVAKDAVGTDVLTRLGEPFVYTYPTDG